jgi:hypothetical protein
VVLKNKHTMTPERDRLRGRRVVLIELNDSHDDCVLSWYLTLRAEGCAVAIAAPNAMRDRLTIDDDTPWCHAHAQGSLLERIRMMLRVRRFVRSFVADTIVLTTASGTTQRDLMAFMPGSCLRIGVLHYVSKVGISTNQRRLERNLDAYAVIAPHLRDLLEPSLRIPVHCIPITARPEHSHAVVPRKLDNEWWIGIPGSLEPLRRDYVAVFNEHVMTTLPRSVRFVILGSVRADTPERAELARAFAQWSGRVHTLSGYVTHEQYHAMAAQCDVILPLLHPGRHEYSDFLTTKSSGAFTIAWAHRLPMLLERGFERFQDLRGSATFYDVDDLPRVLTAFATDTELLRAARARAAADPITDAFRQDATVRLLTDHSTPLS